MSFIAYITTILLGLQPAYGDNETWQERTDRMTIVAEAIDDASSRATCSDKYNVEGCVATWPQDKKSLAILLVTKGYWESKFAKNVHEGKCRPYECDSYRKDGHLIHKARSPWQIQRTGLVSKEEYSKMNSSSQESTTVSANVAVRYLSIGMRQCHTIMGAMSIYGGVKSCNWSGVKHRLSFYKKLMEKSPEDLSAAKEKQEQLHKSFVKVSSDK
ncbi:MAG: hypothetical protein EBU90_17325 [Proteobacteria bacterium]|nr:hypothetical protein [Pseudomonadota bacterium]